MIFTCKTQSSWLPQRRNDGLVMKVVQSSSREVVMHVQLTQPHLERLRVLPLAAVLYDFMSKPSLSALVMPRAVGLDSWVNMLSTSTAVRAVMQVVEQLVQVCKFFSSHACRGDGEAEVGVGVGH